MTEYLHQSFLESIHSKDRQILDTKIFPQPTKVSLLHFLGAADYFITSFGAIWHRSKVYANKHGVVTKGYQPLVMRDAEFPYPWVLLETTMGKIWLPTNQILGWAFDPQEKIEPTYFLSTNPGVYPQEVDDYYWSTVKPVSYNPRSRYLAFMRKIYATRS